MTAQTRNLLYTYFQTNDIPTQQQFANLIDSSLNISDTSAQVITSDVSATGKFTFNNAVIVGSPIGGNKGIGTLNAVGVYVNGTLITTSSAGGSGTVNVGVSGQVAFYPSNSNTVGGTSNPSVTSLTATSLNAGSLTFNTTTGIVGTTTNNNAAAGSVGEYIESFVTVGLPVSVPTTTPTNITSINLTAGDWDVYSQCTVIVPSTKVLSLFYSAISTTSATLDDNSFGFSAFINSGITGDGNSVLTINAARRLSLTTTTPVYLVANLTANSNVPTSGGLFARRVR